LRQSASSYCPVSYDWRDEWSVEFQPVTFEIGEQPLDVESELARHVNQF
jgi:hypothetical protein